MRILLLALALLTPGCAFIDKFYESEFETRLRISSDEESPPACPACASGAGFLADTAFLERKTRLVDGIGTLHLQVTTKSPDAQAFHDQGLAYLHSYVWLEAARSFHEAIRLDAECAMAWVGLARAEQGLLRTAAAHDAIAHAEALAGKVTPKEQRLIALRRQQIDAQNARPEDQKQKHAEYKRALDDALAAFPDEPELWIQRGNAEERSPDGRGQRGMAASIAFYESALRRCPEHMAAHHYLVHSFENVGDYASAVRHAREYVRLAPQVPHAHHMAGHVLPRMQQWDEALTRFLAADALAVAYAEREGVAAGDDWHVEHNLALLGWTCLRLAKPGDAERAFERLAKTPIRDPVLDYNHIARAELLLAQGRVDEALLAANAVSQELGYSAQVAGHAVACEALLALGRTEDARARLREAKAALARGKEQLGARAGDFSSLVTSFVTIADGLSLLHGTEAARGETALLAYADSVAKNPRFDAWGAGLFRLQRIAMEARRVGREAFAKSVVERMRVVDAAYHAE